MENGGSASATSIQAGGKETVAAGATDRGATVAGILSVSGTAENVTVQDGGHVTATGTVTTATVQEGGALTLHKGATATGVSLATGATESVAAGATDTGAKIAGSMTVAGSANTTTVQNGGSMTVAGTAKSVIVQKGGVQTVTGYAQGTTVAKGGKVQVKKGGIVRGTTVASSGKLTAQAGAVVSSVTLKAGATMSIASGNILYGNNTFTGATVTGGTAKKRVSLAKKAILTIGTNTTMKKLHLNASNAVISITGTGDTLGSVQTNKNTNISYDVSKVSAKSTAYMLALSTKNTQKSGNFSISVKKNQGVGIYELSKNIVQKNTKYTVNLGSTKQGTATLNGLGLIKGRTIYTVNSGASNAVNLTVATAASKTLKGTNKADKITGAATWDVFYGGKGNDTITGKGGQDVTVYDSTNWGKDVIARTNGSMTLLFNGLKASDIVTKIKGTTMTITRKSDAKQSITVKGWSDSTHTIVYGSGMTAFNKLVKVSTPTTAQTTAARNEAFKKAGLASA